jgi:hypothetical protein
VAGVRQKQPAQRCSALLPVCSFWPLVFRVSIFVPCTHIYTGAHRATVTSARIARKDSKLAPKGSCNSSPVKFQGYTTMNSNSPWPNHLGRPGGRVSWSRVCRDTGSGDGSDRLLEHRDTETSRAVAQARYGDRGRSLGPWGSPVSLSRWKR